MAKNPDQNSAADTTTAASQPTPAPAQSGPNFVLTLHRADHPGNRSSYTIPGHPGNVVIFNTLFANGKPPATLTLDAELVSPKADTKTDKAAAQAAKLAEKARKAQEKIEAAQRKAEEKKAKAEAALKAAQDKIAAAQAGAAAKS